MAKLPQVSGRKCISALLKAGFIVDRQNGSHATLIRDDPKARTTVPNGNKTLKPGTLRNIIKSAGLTVEEFIALL